MKARVMLWTFAVLWFKRVLSPGETVANLWTFAVLWFKRVLSPGETVANL